MSLEENQQREIEKRVQTSEDKLRAALRSEQRSFRSEMRAMFVVFFAANQAIAHAGVGVEVGGVAAGFVGAIYVIPRFLNR